MNILLTILYIIFFCFPAFMFAQEGSFNIGCSGWCVCIIGFPGVICGLIVRALKNEHEHQVSEKIRVKCEREAAIQRQIEKQREIDLANQQAQRISYYKQSGLMTEIIRFLTKHGTPNKITIHFDRIESIYTGGVDRFDFLTHGINKFDIPDITKHRVNTSEMYLLGCAINQILGNQFSVSESNELVVIRKDGENKGAYRLRYVELTRNLQNF